MKWIEVETQLDDTSFDRWAEQVMTNPPTVEGHYRVLIDGDSETMDGHVIYEFEAYETWAFIHFDPGDGALLFSASHDEEIETMLAYCGPFEVPKRAG